MSLRIVFMGTPEFAVPSLAALLDAGYDVVAVLTAPDRLGGRGGQQLIESAVKHFADEKQLQILQPANLKSPEFIASLRDLKADLQVVVAFRMLPEIVWSMPPLGTMNLHGSLLPAYRGAAPINWAIINGERMTGVTTFMLQHTIDTGDILLQKTLEIGPDETAGELHDRMMHLGAHVVLESVRGIEGHTLLGTPQNPNKVSYAPKITHETCRINFNLPAVSVHNFIRGLSPYPTAWTMIDGAQLNVYRSEVLPESHMLKAGVIGEEKDFIITCKEGKVRLLEVQMQGKRRMSAREFLNGYNIKMKSVEQQA
ncbi:MAG TPA: methionyl-tRNA formyltransferase [Saprospiraceae bacterium]|nr:methionyl-tRNA formyltransferase [Saprospiraceae bacterium]